ncbi:MAG: hypothetical protein JWN73_3307 [Betaproteobacteria bacterium]|nr:hypothetical protein [Betaproteobacteria bacterium]
MQHDLKDQLRALKADHQSALDAANSAREALLRRIQAAKDGQQAMRPLQEFLLANDQAGAALTRARHALERFAKAHPEVG